MGGLQENSKFVGTCTQGQSYKYGMEFLVEKLEKNEITGRMNWGFGTKPFSWGEGTFDGIEIIYVIFFFSLH